MKELKGYSVLRLSKIGKNCRGIMDFKKGILWYEKFTEIPKITKEEIIEWIRQLIEAVFLICSMWEGRERIFLNPYGIVIGEDHILYFLDMDEEENKVFFAKGQQKKIREKFAGNGEEEEKMLYTVGKMIECMMYRSDIYPRVTRKERFWIKKLISICIQKGGLKKERKLKRTIRFLEKNMLPFPVFAVVLIGTIVCILATRWVMVGNASLAKRESSMENATKSRGETEFLQQGKRYFLEFDDYEKSRMCFQKTSEENAENYVVFSEFMEGNIGTEIVRKHLEQMKVKDMEDVFCMLKVYKKLDDQKDNEKILSLADQYLRKNDRKEKTLDVEERFEVLAFLQEICEESDRKEEAAICDKELNQLEVKKERLESYYIERAERFMNRKEWKKAEEICLKGIERLPVSDELKSLRIQCQCMIPGQNREQLLGVLSSYIAQNPNLVKDEKIKKIVSDYQLKMEGGKVWEEK